MPGGTFGLVIAVMLPAISMMHFASRRISRVLKGRTRTATLTDDIVYGCLMGFQSGGWRK